MIIKEIIIYLNNKKNYLLVVWAFVIIPNLLFTMNFY